MRSRLNRFAAICSCTLLLCGFAVAQSDEWKSLIQETQTLYRQGKYDHAVVAATKAREIAERDLGPEHPSVATSLNNLALLYLAQGQYAAAEPLYKRSLAILEKALGPEHPNVAALLESISDLYARMGKAEEAKQFADRAAKIRLLKR